MGRDGDKEQSIHVTDPTLSVNAYQQQKLTRLIRFTLPKSASADDGMAAAAAPMPPRDAASLDDKKNPSAFWSSISTNPSSWPWPLSM